MSRAIEVVVWALGAYWLGGMMVPRFVRAIDRCVRWWHVRRAQRGMR